MNARNAMGLIKILGIIPKLSLNIIFVASYSKQLNFRRSTKSIFTMFPEFYSYNLAKIGMAGKLQIDPDFFR